jgi:hypothetical protein
MTTEICGVTPTTPPDASGNWCQTGAGIWVNLITGLQYISGTKLAGRGPGCGDDLRFDCTTGEYWVKESHFKTDYPDARLDYNGVEFAPATVPPPTELRGVAGAVIQDQIITNSTCETIAVMGRLEYSVTYAATTGQTLRFTPQMLVNGAVHISSQHEVRGLNADPNRVFYHGFDYKLPNLGPAASYTIGIDIDITPIPSPVAVFNVIAAVQSSFRIWSGTA